MDTASPSAANAARPRRESPLRLPLRYPIPFVALAGLGLGAALIYLAGAGPLGNRVWFATLLVGGVPLIFATVRRLWAGRFASDVIAAVAIGAAIVLDLFFPGVAFAGVIIVLMQSGGEALEAYAFRRATSSLEELLRRAPRTARRRSGSEIEEIPVEEVRPGDILSIRRGDLIPVDGTVVSTRVTIDESAVTGEPLPRTHVGGDTLLSGSANVGEPFDLRALRTSGQSQYAKIVELVRTAQGKKPAIQRLADRYAVWFTPATLVLAVVAGLLTRSALTSLSVLVVATPCPLILATPIAVIGAIDRASDRGIVVKGGGAIEQLGGAKAVLFDKTGTITSGRPAVERVVGFRGRTSDEVLRLAGALELLSSHPLAGAVARAAKSQHRELPPVEGAHEFPGAGVSGTVEGHRVVVGSRALCAAEGVVALDAERREIESSGPLAGRLVAFVLIDGDAAGAIVFSDQLRPEAAGLIARLHGLGVRHVGLLTGDRRENAVEIGREAGVDAVDADLLPEQKVERVGEVRRRLGTTVMVGDGINDAAALATASVGVAMGAHGSGISAEAADVVLLVDDVSRVPEGIALGQRMLTIARQGIYFGLGSSILLMAIASFGAIPPALGAVLQEGIDVAVIFNALRVRYGNRTVGSDAVPPTSTPGRAAPSPRPQGSGGSSSSARPRP